MKAIELKNVTFGYNEETTGNPAAYASIIVPGIPSPGHFVGNNKKKYDLSTSTLLSNAIRPPYFM